MKMKEKLEHHLFNNEKKKITEAINNKFKELENLK